MRSLLNLSVTNSRVAEITLDNNHPDELQALYAHNKLRVPSVIQSFTPAKKPQDHPATVELNL